uniref:Origin recognition complex subunit 1 n=1 Tax=Chelydra serpentina TaxID=8475 RepID=A0A8C3RPG0_CHESE
AEIMNTRQQCKRIYSWVGRAKSSDQKMKTFQYRGILIKSERSLTEMCILLGEFVLVEGANADQPFVAKLLKLYEDGSQEKHAVVQWFSRITELPLNKRKLLRREVSPQEIFLDKAPGYGTDINVETIIKNVKVIPLAPEEVVPVRSKGKQIFFVKESWDGKCFKPLSPGLLSELKEAEKKKRVGSPTPLTDCQVFPSDFICSLKAETDRVTRSTMKTKNIQMEIESRHSASKSSLSKERHSQRVANGINTPGARKKLQLNSMYTAILYLIVMAMENVQGQVQNLCLLITMIIRETKQQQKTFSYQIIIPRCCCAAVFKLSLDIHCLVFPNLFFFFSFLNISEQDQEDDYLPSTDCSDSSSSEEEESMVPCTPKRKTRSSTTLSTPKSSRKPSDTTPANTPRKSVRFLEAIGLKNICSGLHVSTIPGSLPCREEEFQDIYNFVESKLIDGTGGCMYISGVPGTGKTATVHEVIRCLQQAAENDELPSFQFIEINGMKLTDPHQAYVQILQLLTGQKVTATHAAELLAKLFSTPGPKRKTTVLIVDELDLLWTRKQDVMYNLFDWPTQRQAKLIILAIANTMDLPERIMMNRVASRLGLTRMSFQPYTYKQLQQIISSRLNHIKAFEEDAIQLVSRKVAALSGDARRCLDICRRSTEICEFSSQKSASGLVSMAHVMKAIDEMFSSPYINSIRNASLHEQMFLKAIIAEFRRSGLEEATVQQIYHQHVALCRIEGLQIPTVSEIMAICSRLGACRFLLVESNNKYLHVRVRLNISQDDVMYALKQE